MKIAQEIRAGNVIMVGKDAQVVLKAEFTKSGRNASVVKLERKDVTYSYFADPLYVFVDSEFNPFEVEAESMGDTLNYVADGMEAELVIYNDKPIAVEIPQTIVREIAYTEPAVKGDTSGKATKPAKLKTGFVVAVPLFCATGDKIEIDSPSGEYRSRFKG